MNSPGKKILARKRWELLRRAIQKESIETVGNPLSKRSFENYAELLSINQYSDNLLKVDIYVDDKIHEVYVHRDLVSCSVDLKILLNDLRDFDLDRTGRITIWPSSQILTYWCLKNLNYFEGKAILELGCGFHALPGLSIAKYCQAQEVVLSDGDPKNCAEIVKSLGINVLETKSTSVFLLRWEGCNSPELESRFDVIIAADIVYNASTFHLLVETIARLLKPGGELVLFNPSRVTELAEFLAIAKESLLFSSISKNESYDNFITTTVKKIKELNPCFVPEWHYPFQVILQKY